MAKISNIQSVVLGDDVRVNVSVTDITTGLTISKAWLTVKLSPSDDDPGAAQAVITGTVSSDGQITNTGGAGTGVMYFVLSNAETDDLSPDIPYVYDVQLKMSDNSLYTPLVGKIVFTQSVTDATS